MLDTLRKDLRFAARLLAKEPSFTAVVVVVLGLGIGLTNAMFMVVNAWFLRQPPYEQPDRVVWLVTRDALGRSLGVSYPDFDDWRRTARTFSGIAVLDSATMHVRDEDHPAYAVSGAYVSANAFSLLGQRPLLGRNFRPEDERPGAAAVVMLGHRAWTDRYAGDPSIVGRSVIVNRVPSTVIGVMRGGTFPLTTADDIWVPLAQAPRERLEARDARSLTAYARLTDGAKPEQASAELSVISEQLARVHPETNRGIEAAVQTYHEHFFLGGGRGPKSALLFAGAGAVVLVLLVTCANVANLMLARSARRIREVGIRTSLGATRGRIVRQLLVESVLLAMIGGGTGAAVTVAGLRLMTQAGGPLPDWMRITMDAPVFLMLAVLCMGGGILAGLAPALYASSTGANGLLKAGGYAGTEGLRTRRWTNTLLVGELVLTVVLLAAAGFLVRTLIAGYGVDPGVADSSRIVTLSLDLESTRYSTAEQRAAFVDRLEHEIGTAAGVRSAAIATQLPLRGGTVQQLELDGRPATTGQEKPNVTTLAVTSRYFETLGVPLVQGRAFSHDDGAPGQQHAIVNQRFAALYFAGVDPIGRRLQLSGRGAASAWLTVVGVSANVPQRLEIGAADPVVYLPYRAEAPTSGIFVVRGVGDPATTTRVVRERMRELDPDLPLFGFRTFDEVLAQTRSGFMAPSALFGVLALVALGLTAISVYGLTAYTVAMRTREIGIRITLGAQARQIRWLVGRQVSISMVIGLVVGLVGAVGVGRGLQNVIPQTSGTDPIGLLAVVAVLVIACVAACVGPARRATRLNPVVALRYE